MASHNIGSLKKPFRVTGNESDGQIENLMKRVNMETAFLNLAKNDEELVDEMKKAIVRLQSQVSRREVLCVAIEHNVKYLTSIFL